MSLCHIGPASMSHIIVSECARLTAIRWVGYTKVWNFLDHTALTLPTGEVSRELDPVNLPPYEPRSDIDKWNWELYDLESMAGHAIGIQVIGRRLDEERVLGAAKVIDEILRR